MNADKFEPARQAFTEAYAASRRWDRLVGEAITAYGDTTETPVSGIYAYHFPEAVRDELRATAREVTNKLDVAWSLKPKRANRATMLRIKQEIISRDGKGFYG